MKQTSHSIFCMLGAVFLLAAPFCTQPAMAEEDNVIRIGVDVGISGSLSEPVADILNGIALASAEVEKKGGVTIGKKKYTVKIIEYDNKGDISTASQLAIQAIVKDRIHALIMPLFSDIAVQVSRVINGYKIPAVCVNTTSPKITKNRPYAFRTSASYAEMARATRQLATKDWQAKKVAVLYDEYNGYATDMVQAVLAEFTSSYGAESVVAVKTFRRGEMDYRQQLAEIIAAEPDFLYTPQYINQVSEIVKQAREMGWKKPITGSNVWGLWGSEALMEQCGDLCKNLFYTANFVAKGSEGAMKTFTKRYREKYQKTPTSNAAYGYDAFTIIIKALERMDSISGNLRQDRTALRDAIAKTNYEGAIGKIFYQGTGEPVKCPIVTRIDNNGEFVQHFISCAE